MPSPEANDDYDDLDFAETVRDHPAVPPLAAAVLRFGRYEVLRKKDGTLFELGRGGMGVTYKALDPGLRRTVVLKVIRADLLGNDPQARARFRREARSAAGVHHPHIATVFDIGEERGEDYYVMEFIAGEDLHTRLKRDGPLSVAAVVQIARQVAEALDAAWEQGIVHRDIKPGNLMLAHRPPEREAREGPRVKVVDFGLAKALKVAGASTTDAASSILVASTLRPIFSPAYASPEQIEDEAVDIRSDFY
ncbi:MAG: serine/threonine protein kinase, partial [Verrucomicrobia bacterium]|nr:serine/threonine protein kinase [Verrucomicrobiota bacterium]